MMGDTKNLRNDEAIKKMKDMAEGKTAMFCTFTGNTSIEARPMHTQLVDDDGCFWFMGDKRNNSTQQIEQINKVQLLYALNDQADFMSIEGSATLTGDQSMIDQLWSRFANTWFDGKDDPNIILLKVLPDDGFYWDTKHGKWVSMIKIMAGAITGNETDDSVEGTLKV